MQATIQFRKPDSSDTCSWCDPSFNPQGPGPSSCQCACNQSILYWDLDAHRRDGVRTARHARIGTFSQLVRSNAAAVPCEDRP